ncbi:MAG: hypothetical protein HOQ01_08220 [Lysobacter sp.]|nr:hypothetical protein [Lysobacter sp.]
MGLVLIAALAWWFWHGRGRGRDDAVVRDLESIAMSACGRMEVVTGRTTLPMTEPQPSIASLRRDPRRAWALDYLERACAGYDASAALNAWRVQPPDLVLAKQLGREEATSVALEDLRTSESITELMFALDYLRGTNQLPEGMTLRRGNGIDNPMRVIEFAVEPIRCAGIGSCSGDSLETAWFCLDTGCPRGITLEQIRRAQMPPAEVAAGLALREQLMRYRASPN